MRVAESRSSSVSGLLQLLHSTYLRPEHAPYDTTHTFSLKDLTSHTVSRAHMKLLHCFCFGSETAWCMCQAWSSHTRVVYIRRLHAWLHHAATH